VARFAASLGNVQRAEVLPFHQLGRFKWQQLGMKYELADTATPASDELHAAQSIFRSFGLYCPA
jgi:pyruvate formate lyase activating enzyme